LETSNGNLGLVGGTIHLSPEEEPIPDGTLLIHKGKIAAVGGRASLLIPDGVPTLDCSGLSILAGFWNSHVHFFERKWANAEAIPAAELERQLQDMLTRYGFTSVFDLSSLWQNTRRLRERIELGGVPGPRIRSTGEGLVPANPGLPPDSVTNVMGLMKTPLPEVVDAEQATAATLKLLEAGVDGIKLFASAPSRAAIPESVMRAAVEVAHRSGKPAFVHPNDAPDLLNAVRAGVDVVAHTTPASGSWDAAVLAAMHQRQVALTPTLTLWKYFLRHDRASVQEQTVNTAIGQLRAWFGSGGTVLFGTDLGAVEYDPRDEYALMAEAGMSFRQILATLTTGPAKQFREANRLGRIRAGFEADLVVLKGDPSSDLNALTAVQYTLRSGEIIYRGHD